MKHAIRLSIGSVLLFLAASSTAWAQLEIKSTGNVLIGDGPASPDHSELTVQRFSLEHSTFNSAIRAKSEANGSPHNFGVAAEAGGANIINLAIHGKITDPSATTNYAGRFNGDVHVTGTINNPSDARLKEGVRSLAVERAVLPRLLQLRPQTFTYTQSPEFAQLSLPRGEHFGLIAQEVEEIFPELVREELDVAFPETDTGRSAAPNEIRYKSLNYIEMIPILVQAIQEQQARIEELEAALGRR